VVVTKRPEPGRKEAEEVGDSISFIIR